MDPLTFIGDEIDELRRRSICSDCIGENFLSNEIRNVGDNSRCGYCNKQQKTVCLEEVAERVKSAIEEHYVLCSTFFEDVPKIGTEGEPLLELIQDIVAVDPSTAIHIQKILDFGYPSYEIDISPFSEDAHYIERLPDASEWQRDWRFLQDSLKSDARFFNLAAKNVLDSIFEDIESLEVFGNKKPIIVAGPNRKLSKLFRARLFQSVEHLEHAMSNPHRELAAPPQDSARSGRMNPLGISVFYGASRAEVAIAEVRPPVGSNVLVGTFNLVREVRLLDLRALAWIRPHGSVFDPEFAKLKSRAQFLMSFEAAITKPVMPDDEAFEYLPTQAVAEYLSSSPKLKLDGIIYSSAQSATGEQNVVLFRKSSKVKPLCNDRSITANTETWEDSRFVIDYFIVETVFNTSSKVTDEDSRQDTLELDLSGLTVHEVQSIQVHCKEYRVRRTVREENNLF